jgi:hypothetical protein
MPPTRVETGGMHEMQRIPSERWSGVHSLQEVPGEVAFHETMDSARKTFPVRMRRLLGVSGLRRYARGPGSYWRRIMKTADYRRAAQKTLRWGDLSFVAAEAVRCIAIIHNNDDVAVRLSTKAFSRHRWRHGPRRDPERDQRIKDAIHWVRFRRGSLGVAKAIQLAAEEYRVTENALKNAYGGHVAKFRKLKPPK